MERPEAYMGDQPYIFISYAHRDSDQVWPIILKLQGEGYRIWYDDGISPGTEWDANIANHIRNCSFFAAFISRNYLGSDNCKDELSFVRDLHKNRVLIYLEEVKLPDELQMRLGRLQAIYWNKDGEKKALKKLMRSPGLDICRESAQKARSAASEPEVLAPPAASVSELPGESVTGPKSASATPTPPVTQSPSGKTSPKKNPFLFVGIGAVLLLVLVFVLKSGKSTQTTGSSTATQGAKADRDSSDSNSDINSENAAAASDDSADEAGAAAHLAEAASAYSTAVASSSGGSMLAGILVADNPYSFTFEEQQDLDYNGDTYTISRLPFTTISSYDDQNSIILGFYDKFDGDFYFYGTYSIDGETLTISPGGSAGSFSKDCAPLTESLTYGIKLYDDGVQITYSDNYVNLCGMPAENDLLVLKGALSEGSKSYRGLQSLDLVLDLKNEEIQKCVLILEDGKTANVDSFTHWEGTHTLQLSWSSVDYVLNGRPVTEDVNGHLHFTYINQNPAGFTIVEDYETPHYYQNLSGLTP